MDRYHVRGSSWGHRTDGMDKRQKLLHEQSFLESCGANLTSKDVHWPMTLAIRSSLAGRSSGLRLRSAAANARRREKKIAKGYIKGDGKGKSGWERTAAPAAAGASSSEGTAGPAAAGASSSNSARWDRSASSSSTHWEWQPAPHWQGRSSGSTWQWSTWSWQQWHQQPEAAAPDTDDDSWGVWV